MMVHALDALATFSAMVGALWLDVVAPVAPHGVTRLRGGVTLLRGAITLLRDKARIAVHGSCMGPVGECGAHIGKCHVEEAPPLALDVRDA